jgi:hypothetical protein
MPSPSFLQHNTQRDTWNRGVGEAPQRNGGHRRSLQNDDPHVWRAPAEVRHSHPRTGTILHEKAAELSSSIRYFTEKVGLQDCLQ